MLRISSLGVLGLSVLAPLAGCGFASRESADRAAIQGTWQGTSVKGLEDLEDLEDLEALVKFVFTDERFTMDLALAAAEGTYTLDPRRKPKSIDLIMSSGDLMASSDPKEPAVLRGRYELEGDRLRLCLRFEEEGGRPSKFAAKPGSGDLLIELRRVAGAVQQDPHRGPSQDNLKRIGVAMHNYHDAHKCFPPAVGYGPDGTTPHSWRVALLPFLGAEEEALYHQYRLDEPWDSPHNRGLLEKIPAVYRAPGDPVDSANASVFVLVGPDTLFSGEQGTRLAQVTDGSSNTLMVLEARRPIPWTKPEDIPCDPDEPIPQLGGLHPEGFYAVFADGAVRGIPKDVDEQALRALISRAGGEVSPRLPETF